MSRRLSTVLIGALPLLCACSGSKRQTPSLTAPTTPTIATEVIGSGTDALAAELLLAGAQASAEQWHGDQVPVADPELAQALDAMAVDHLRSTSFATGSGPGLLGSATVRRLAAAPTAPPDRDGDGSNLDEALEEEAARVLAFARSVPSPAALIQPVLPWRTRSAGLAAPFGDGPVERQIWQTRDLGDRHVRGADAADFLLLRGLASRRLTTNHVRGTYGDDSDGGSLGLLALLQVLAAEETLFVSGFTNGGAPGPLGDPEAYDPRSAPRWLPAEYVVDLDQGQAGALGGFRLSDGASDLTALGTLMRASADLASLADRGDPLAVPELFRGHPFRPPPRQPIPPSISWTRDIQPLMNFRCGICHLTFVSGGFSLASYQTMLTGGNKTRALNLPFIVPGNAEASLFQQILTGPPPPFFRMPLGGSLPVEEIALVGAWIDGGALENPPAPPAPPRPGEDMAAIAFGNLAALHLDPATGALHHRYEADGPSGHATALATGHALTALAALDRVSPGLQVAGTTPATVLRLAAEYAAATLVGADGQALDAVEIATGLPGVIADLRGQAALTAGLLAAAARLPSGSPADAAGRAAAAHLLSAYVDATGLFGPTPGHSAGSSRATVLAELLAALRHAVQAGVPGAEDRRIDLLRRLRPVLAFAEWSQSGEVLGDGIADSDGDGIAEPAAAGGEFGRLPLLVDEITIDPETPLPDRPITWSVHIRPLLLSKCGECHMNGNELGQYRLDTRRSLATPGESRGRLPLLVPGDPSGSFFFEKLVTRQPAFGSQMPLQRTPLGGAAMAQIQRWIEDGATGR